MCSELFHQKVQGFRDSRSGPFLEAFNLFFREIMFPPTDGILVCKVSKVFQHIFPFPVLTRERVRLAFAVAVATDVLQLALGPFGWAFADELLDVAAMLLTWRLIGFHPLLLPTFVLEFLPLADMLPTWTGCVAIVVALRKRQETIVLPPPASSFHDV